MRSKRLIPLRKLLVIPLLFLCLVQGMLMTSWVGAWGFFGGIAHWFSTFIDPISFAAGVDLMGLMAVIAVWMVWREGRWTKTLTIVTIPFIVFPSIGLLLYLIMSEKSLPGEVSQGR